MTINFNINDKVIVDAAFVNNSSNQYLPQTLERLGNLGSVCTVTTTGVTPDTTVPPSLSYIGLVPSDINNPAYNAGRGVVLYFATDDLLNNSFELFTGALSDLVSVTVKNLTGSTINRGKFVYQNGFDTNSNCFTVNLTRANNSSRSQPLGITLADIEDGATGPVLIEGTFTGIDLSGFNRNDYVYLSNSSGNISTSAGTNTRVVGFVLNNDVNGTMYLPTAGAIPGLASATVVNGYTETGLLILRGRVDTTDQSILGGSGFTTAQPDGAGTIQIIYTGSGFDANPSVIATAEQSSPPVANVVASVYSNDQTACRLTRAVGGVLTDGIISFIVVGLANTGPS